jgi:hypothetical protein
MACRLLRVRTMPCPLPQVLPRPSSHQQCRCLTPQWWANPQPTALRLATMRFSSPWQACMSSILIAPDEKLDFRTSRMSQERYLTSLAKEENCGLRRIKMIHSSRSAGSGINISQGWTNDDQRGGPFWPSADLEKPMRPAESQVLMHFGWRFAPP